MIRRKIVFDHDSDADFSWLKQDHYKPGHKDYSPLYRTKADMDAGRNPIDPDWYCNPENHVALGMLVYEMGDDDQDWECVDSLGSIDFLADSSEWTIGTFYNVGGLPEGYLRDLAREAGLPE